jgi:hypothetical protein
MIVFYSAVLILRNETIFKGYWVPMRKLRGSSLIGRRQLYFSVEILQLQIGLQFYKVRALIPLPIIKSILVFQLLLEDPESLLSMILKAEYGIELTDGRRSFYPMPGRKLF